MAAKFTAGPATPRLPPISDITFDQREQSSLPHTYGAHLPSPLLPLPGASGIGTNGPSYDVELPSLPIPARRTAAVKNSHGIVSVPRGFVPPGENTPISKKSGVDELSSAARFGLQFQLPSAGGNSDADTDNLKERKRAQNRENGRRFRAAKRQRWLGLEEQNTAYSEELMYLKGVLHRQQAKLRNAGIQFSMDELLEELQSFYDVDAELYDGALSPMSNDGSTTGGLRESPVLATKSPPLVLPCTAAVVYPKLPASAMCALQGEDSLLLWLLQEVAGEGQESSAPWALSRLCLIDLEGQVISESSARCGSPIQSVALSQLVLNESPSQFWDAIHSNDQIQVKILVQHMVSISQNAKSKGSERVAVTYRRKADEKSYERVKGTIQLLTDERKMPRLLIAETPIL